MGLSEDSAAKWFLAKLLLLDRALLFGYWGYALLFEAKQYMALNSEPCRAESLSAYSVEEVNKNGALLTLSWVASLIIIR